MRTTHTSGSCRDKSTPGSSLRALLRLCLLLGLMGCDSNHSPLDPTEAVDGGVNRDAGSDDSGLVPDAEALGLPADLEGVWIRTDNDQDRISLRTEDGGYVAVSQQLGVFVRMKLDEGRLSPISPSIGMQIVGDVDGHSFCPGAPSGFTIPRDSDADGLDDSADEDDDNDGRTDLQETASLFAADDPSADDDADGVLNYHDADYWRDRAGRPCLDRRSPIGECDVLSARLDMDRNGKADFLE
jgi:hypothetical protein